MTAQTDPTNGSARVAVRNPASGGAPSEDATLRNPTSTSPKSALASNRPADTVFGQIMMSPAIPAP